MDGGDAGGAADGGGFDGGACDLPAGGSTDGFVPFMFYGPYPRDGPLGPPRPFSSVVFGLGVSVLLLVICLYTGTWWLLILVGALLLVTGWLGYTEWEMRTDLDQYERIKEPSA